MNQSTNQSKPIQSTNQYLLGAYCVQFLRTQHWQRDKRSRRAGGSGDPEAAADRGNLAPTFCRWVFSPLIGPRLRLLRRL